MAKENTIRDNQVVKIAYTLWVDGQVMDSADANEPLEYLHGHQNIIPGLEKALEGLSESEKVSVTVTPEEGYGERINESIIDLDREMFPEDYPLEIGESLHLQDDESDEIFNAFIVSYDDKNVQVDLNHPLAGKELKFDVEVIEVREATEEEVDAGHLHSSGCSSCNHDCSGGCC